MGGCAPQPCNLPPSKETEMWFIECLLEWFRAIPGEDGSSEWHADDPHDLHDPERITRLQFDDDFRLFERTDK